MHYAVVSTHVHPTKLLSWALGDVGSELELLNVLFAE